MKRLRSYAPMRRVSKKVEREQGDFRAVYDLVDQRSEGRCEFVGQAQAPYAGPTVRCPRQATDHHHVVKPRRSHHDPDLIVHLCRVHHDRCVWPYDRGRLNVSPLGKGRFLFPIIYAADKFSVGAS